ncbi:hypothetical protein JBW_02686 [Pelosinus fermentans JBW45]|uniref:Uncharacterized protein n=1 Tax=Pelosinus fermentans JBW45 TaxID=1192197 RepID=I8U185_9FIRM|nr:hypothetical protein JBW_02686 [Pelosinus fermentans JBW45]
MRNTTNDLVFLSMIFNRIYDHSTFNVEKNSQESETGGTTFSK